MKYKQLKKIDHEYLIQEEQRLYESRTEGMLARKRNRFRLIDAFAGAGGMIRFSVGE